MWQQVSSFCYVLQGLSLGQCDQAYWGPLSGCLFKLSRNPSFNFMFYPPPNLESWLTKQVLLRAGTPWVAERFMNLWRGRFGRSYGLRRHNRAFCRAASSPSNKDGVGQGRRSSDCRLFLTAGDSQEKAQISSLQSLLVHLLHKWYMFDYYPSQRHISKLTAKAK